MLRRIRPNEVREIGTRFGIDMAPEEASEYADLAASLMQTLDPLGYGADAPPPLDAVRRNLGRPRQGDDPFNAIIRRCSVQVKAEGALSGKRIAVKDTISIAGIPLTGGSRVLQGFVPNRDSIVVERVLAAGAEIVAMTNTDSLALSGGGDSSFFGPMLNPFDRNRATGGSSGGSGSSLHYDWIDMTLGGDQGGSIRVPASWCNVIGLKPTFSLVPYTGILGLDPTIDHVGPMGRTAHDVALLLQVIAGKDSSDPRQYEVPTHDYVDAVESAPDDLDGMTIGVLREGLDPLLGGDPGVEEAFHHSVDRLRSMGATVVEVSVPDHLTAGPIGFATFLEGMAATAMSGGSGYGSKGRYWPELAAALQAGLANHGDELSPQSKIMFILGTYLQRQYGGSLYGQAQNLRTELTAAYDSAFEQCDVILAPTTPGLPHEVDAELPMSDFVQRGWAVLGNTSPADLTGHPAISLPMASSGGLPVGVMATARHFEETLLLRLASIIERRDGWFQAPLDLPPETSGV
jgi:amidase